MADLSVEMEYTLRDCLRVFFRQKAVILTAFLTAVVTTTIGLQLRTPEYEAKAKMLIAAEKMVESPFFRELAPYQRTQVTLTQSEVVKSAPVMERVVRALKLYEQAGKDEKVYASQLKRSMLSLKKRQHPRDLSSSEQEAEQFRDAVEGLKANTSVEPIRDTNSILIVVRDFSPVGAATLANAVSRSYLIYDLEQQLAGLQIKYGDKHPIIQQLKDNIDAMQKTLSGAPISNLEAIGPASVKIIEQAGIPAEPIGPSNALLRAAAFLVSIFLALILALAFEYLDQTFKTPQQTENFIGVPLLGSIPKAKNKRDGFMRNLTDQLYLVSKDKGLKSLLILPVEDQHHASDGVVYELSKFISKQANKKILVVDADLRRPTLHKKFNVGNRPGLAEVLEGKSALESVVKAVDSNLSVMPAGTTVMNPLTLFDSERMRHFLDSVKSKHDIVLINAASSINYKDGVVLSLYSDATILLINEGQTRRHVAKVALNALNEKKISPLGFVFANRTFPIPKFIYERI